jgi:hypothetical protein
MDFMMIVKAAEESARDLPRDSAELANLLDFHDSMHRAGVVLTVEALQPSRRAVRVGYSLDPETAPPERDARPPNNGAGEAQDGENDGADAIHARSAEQIGVKVHNVECLTRARQMHVRNHASDKDGDSHDGDDDD